MKATQLIIGGVVCNVYPCCTTEKLKEKQIASPYDKAMMGKYPDTANDVDIAPSYNWKEQESHE